MIRKILEISLPDEEWRPVEESPMYWVSNLGRVISLRFKRQFGVVGIIKGTADLDGYIKVHISLPDGTRVQRFVHRLVAQAFIYNPRALPVVNHINEVKDDNRLSNLEWCTIQYNSTYGSSRERAAKSRGVTIKAISNDGLEEIFNSYREAERKGFTRPSIVKCIRDSSRIYKGRKWELVD